MAGGKAAGQELRPQLASALRAAHRARHGGDLDSARTAFEQVEREAAELALPDLERAALAGQGEVELQAGDPAGAAKLFRAAGEVSREVTCIALDGDPIGAVALGEAAIGQADRADHALLAGLQAALIVPYVQLGASGRVCDAAQRALLLSSRLDDAGLLAYIHRETTHAFIETERLDDALVHADRALRLSGELGLTTDSGLCHLARAGVYRAAERLTDAACELVTAIETFRRTCARLYYGRATAILAGVRVAQGRTCEAWALVWELLGKRDPWTDGYLHRVAGMCAPDRSERELYLRRSAELFAAQRGQVELVETCREWARLLTSQGRLAEAVAVYDLGLRGATTVAHA